MTSNPRTDPVTSMTADDLRSPAEIFISKGIGRKRNALGYHRFDTAAEAIDFAVEAFSDLGAEGLVMTVDDKRFNLAALRALHRSEGMAAKAEMSDPAE
ncbi:hypothetical protein RDV64_09880 [Acuticoccus sp. MNP-M23]|uniref:hypothetical protein n=1 Tax=Acuticoccus sp. MNP-M23 TaxID=3072793 RepID=UPI002814FD85|nr:hypothetical protein [Acuticoccus sp. MNP-M23]WMS44663.1 hypothetical protein RDV64_09880 [Acuticoccus sp. MNP-M23]